MTKRIPLIRDLCRCRSQDHIEAAKEVFATVLLAVLPVWLGAIILMLIPRVSVAHYVGEFLSSGEALLVSAALVGPSVYIITKKYGDFPKSLSIHFPQGWFLVLLWLVISMLVTAIFGLQRIYAQVAQTPNTPTIAPLFDAQSMQNFSFGILFLSVASLYIVTVFRNFTDDGAAAAMHSETADFLNDWKKQ
jgi:hypothetical protein